MLLFWLSTLTVHTRGILFNMCLLDIAIPTLITHGPSRWHIFQYVFTWFCSSDSHLSQFIQVEYFLICVYLILLFWLSSLTIHPSGIFLNMCMPDNAILTLISHNPSKWKTFQYVFTLYWYPDSHLSQSIHYFFVFGNTKSHQNLTKRDS